MPQADSDRRRKVLQDFIKERRLKLSPWAKRAKVSEAAIRNFLAKRSKSLSIGVYEALARAEGVSVATLTGEEDPRGGGVRLGPGASDSAIAFQITDEMIDGLGLELTARQRGELFEEAMALIKRHRK
jgi:transcriptional regulator with XRE-family HTH domain